MNDPLFKFIEYCENNPTVESCGVVVNKRGKKEFIPCKNISLTPQNDFILDPIDYANATADGDIIYIAHSHVNQTEDPSSFDKASCNKGTVPWIIYSLKTKKYYNLTPEKYTPSLIGREYFYGVQDCWTLIRDIYKAELGIELINPKDPDPEWWLHGKNYFGELIEEAQFNIIKDRSVKKYDVLLMQTHKSPVFNHSAMYYGDNIIIHHAYNRLSCREQYGGYWEKITQLVIRYKDLM